MSDEDRIKYGIIDSHPMNQTPIKREGVAIASNHYDSTYDYFNSAKEARRWLRALKRRAK